MKLTIVKKSSTRFAVMRGTKAVKSFTTRAAAEKFIRDHNRLSLQDVVNRPPSA
jgi:hypothetical protein